MKLGQGTLALSGAFPLRASVRRHTDARKLS
jgi:hypothetical protein